jgi:hypothetical protein
MGAKPARPLGLVEGVRAFGVMLGGSALLAAFSLASAIAVLRSVAGRVRPSNWSLLGVTATIVYALFIRPWHLRWGTEPADEARPLPGDQFLPEGGTQILHAITIDAPAEAVWPWLAQIGQDRGGFYSYEWLENLAGCKMRNADRIHPEWQHRKVGETVFLHPAGGMEVTIFEARASDRPQKLGELRARTSRSRADLPGRPRTGSARGIRGRLCGFDGAPALHHGAAHVARAQGTRRARMARRRRLAPVNGPPGRH